VAVGLTNSILLSGFQTRPTVQSFIKIDRELRSYESGQTDVTDAGDFTARRNASHLWTVSSVHIVPPTIMISSPYGSRYKLSSVRQWFGVFWLSDKIVWKLAELRM